MLDSVDTNQTDLNAKIDKSLLSDYELNGTINRAASEGAKFALVLAMLEQDCTYRPYIEKADSLKQETDMEVEHHYRSNPLAANDSYWKNSQHTNQLIHNGQLHSAQLWLAMHPEPLSQHNDAGLIEEDVMANCSLNTQTRIQQAKDSEIKVDETGLYEILQDIEPISAS